MKLGAPFSHLSVLSGRTLSLTPLDKLQGESIIEANNIKTTGLRVGSNRGSNYII